MEFKRSWETMMMMSSASSSSSSSADLQSDEEAIMAAFLEAATAEFNRLTREQGLCCLAAIFVLSDRLCSDDDGPAAHLARLANATTTNNAANTNTNTNNNNGYKKVGMKCTSCSVFHCKNYFFRYRAGDEALLNSSEYHALLGTLTPVEAVRILRIRREIATLRGFGWDNVRCIEFFARRLSGEDFSASDFHRARQSHKPGSINFRQQQQPQQPAHRTPPSGGDGDDQNSLNSGTNNNNRLPEKPLSEIVSVRKSDDEDDEEDEEDEVDDDDEDEEDEPAQNNSNSRDIDEDTISGSRKRRLIDLAMKGLSIAAKKRRPNRSAKLTGRAKAANENSAAAAGSSTSSSSSSSSQISPASALSSSSSSSLVSAASSSSSLSLSPSVSLSPSPSTSSASVLQKRQFSPLGLSQEAAVMEKRRRLRKLPLSASSSSSSSSSSSPVAGNPIDARFAAVVSTGADDRDDDARVFI